MSAKDRFFLYLYCNDLDEMREFYSAILGLDELFFSRGSDGGLGYLHAGVQLTILPSSDELAVDMAWHRQPGWEGGERTSTSWSIQLGDMRAFRAAVRRLRQSDALCFHPEPTWHGYWSFPAKDPMGNTVELTYAPEVEPAAKTWSQIR
jgi:catechol 2,3-dioxygenase-like lactoylglutathione lyase family enzyme